MGMPGAAGLWPKAQCRRRISAIACACPLGCIAHDPEENGLIMSTRSRLLAAAIALPAAIAVRARLVPLSIGGLEAAVRHGLLNLLWFPIGLWATRRVEAMTGDHDSGFIVVDEVVGIWITLLFAVATPLSVMLAFVLFRAFDALKPWPVSHFDKNVPGAMGVMLDDVAAGLMAGLCLLGLRYVGIA